MSDAVAATAWFRDRSVAFKINAITLLVFTVVFGVCTAFLLSFLSDRLTQSASDNLKTSNQRIIRMIDVFANELDLSAEKLGGALALYAGDLQKHGNFRGFDKVVDDFAKATGSVATIFTKEGKDLVRKASTLSDGQGQRVLGTALDPASPAYKALLAGQSYTGRTTLFGRDYMTRYVPLRDDAGAVVGAAFVGIDFTEGLAALKKQIRDIKVGQTGYVFIAERGANAGHAVVHPTLEGKSIIDVKADQGRLIVREMIDQKSGSIRYTPQGESLVQAEKIAVFDTFERWDWLVVSGSFIDEFTADSRAVTKALIASTLLTLLVIGAAIQWITRVWLRAPLLELERVFSRIAAGDLSGVIVVRAKDEIGQLLSAARSMCEQLRSMISDVRQGMQQLSANAESLARSAEEVSMGSRDQSHESMALASAIEELATSVEQMSSHAMGTQTVVAESNSISRNGAQVIGEAVASMNSIALTVRGASEVVSQLGTETEMISRVVGVIREIADQTNLLALNAAIEAARAGESGRGFAVVADEVRKLAERTTASTTEISETILKIQNGAINAVASMRQGVEQVDAGVALASKAGTCIEEMQTGAGQVGLAVSGISDGLREQSAVSETVARNVEEIAQQAESNQERAREAAEASARMSEIAAQTLRSVNRFTT